MERWRLLDLEYRDAGMNLALEEAVARVVGENRSLNTVRFWRSPNAVVIGRSQETEREINFNACEKYETTILRRFTGGGAVYHDWGNLNCAISIHKGDTLFRFDYISQVYEFLGGAIIAALKGLGLDAKFKLINGMISGAEVNDKKVSGLAGAMKWGTIFCHATLLIKSNLTVLLNVLASPEQEPKTRHPSNRSEVITLREELGREVSVSEIKERLIEEIEKTHNIGFFKSRLSQEENELTKQIYKEKYSTFEWNFQGITGLYV